jgi:hypothetical protein
MQGTPTDAPLRDSSGEIRQETMIVNMGPQHPSTHGVLRLLLELDGETVITCKPIIGYLHTGIEKNTEYRTWMQGVTYVTRADYLSPFFNEMGYCLAVERLLGIEAPARAQVIRVLFCELNRISSHLVWLATGGLELGAVSVMLYGFREREVLMDVFESVTGLRMNHAYIRIGGVIMDVHEEGMGKIRDFLRVMPGRPRAVLEPGDALHAVALAPLVAALAAHPEAPAGQRERLVLARRRHHQAHPLVHGTGLHPPHRQGPPTGQLTCHPCRRSILLPMYPVRTPRPSPARGRETMVDPLASQRKL